jgi:hypothetical protein
MLVCARAARGGRQVGYGLVGFFYLFIISMLLMVLIWALIYVPTVRDFFVQVLLAQYLFLPVLSIVVWVYVQRLLMRRLFLSPRAMAGKDGAAASVSDGRFYTPRHLGVAHYEYFSTFVNTMRGIISFLFSRLLYPFGFTLLFSTRLDLSVMVRGFEFMDEGHTSYLGMVLAEHHHNNPVLLMFIHWLTVDVTRRGPSRRACVHSPTLLQRQHGRGSRMPVVCACVRVLQACVTRRWRPRRRPRPRRPRRSTSSKGTSSCLRGSPRPSLGGWHGRQDVPRAPRPRRSMI